MITTAPLEELASYVPALVLRRMAPDVGATMAPSAERFPAAVLVADLSGFTALTEHLSQHSPAGAEELTRILDLYFGHLVAVVGAHGGDVVKFAGDGLLALWYGDEPLATLTQRAVQCGLAVQMMMAPDVWGSVEDGTPPPPLKVRVGVGAGTVTTMHLGGVFGRWELLVTGEAVRQTAQAEAQAQPGEVVIAADAWPLVGASCVGEPLTGGGLRLEGLTEYLPMRPLELPLLVPEMADALRAYLPKAILARLDAGQNAWLAEQRRVTVLFINLPSLHADTPLRQAQALMRTLQSMLYRYEGSISRLGTDGKGPTLVAALGLPPLAHEDDPERGVRAALDIYAALRTLEFSCTIGITTGRALCGAVGGLARREYTMMGTIVNRSARLMQAAAELVGDDAPVILCDATTFRAARTRLPFEELPRVALKGVAEPVAVYRPLAEAPSPLPAATATTLATRTLFGREHEQRLIAERVTRFAQTRQSGALLLEGDSGIGKSSLLQYLRAQATAAELRIAAGAGTPVETPPYHAWRAVFGELLAGTATSQRAEPSEDDGVAQHVYAVLNTLGLRHLAPLLNAVLPLDLPETALTAQLVGQVRADNTRDLLLRLLERTTAQTPLVLSFEDAQWLDESSWALIHAASERVRSLLFAIALRPLVQPPAVYQRLTYRPETQRLQLRGLAGEAVRDLLAQRLGVAGLPETVWRLIATRAQGNPFVSEELLHALRESGALSIQDGTVHLAESAAGTGSGLHLPDTVQGLITSRIDRLTPAQQLTLKVASVIGPSFSLRALNAIHPVEHEPARLVDQLFALQQVGLLVIETFEPELLYAFKHTVGSEVAYNLMSFAQRRTLHRALAEYYEADSASSSDALNAQLAHHWRQADEPSRAVRYMVLAGEQALRGGAYREAVAFLSDALTLVSLPSSEIIGPLERELGAVQLARWERQLGEAYHGMGRLVESREQLVRAVTRLGLPVPSGLRALVAGLVVELLQQAVRQLGPSQLRWPAETIRSEAARAYALLAQLAYYDSQLLASIYAALRSLNLAERAGLSPELAGAYATAYVTVGAVPVIARLYRRRAWRASAQLGHLPTQGWVAEAQALHDVGHTNWRRAQAALAIGLAVAERLGDQRRRAECVATQCLVAAHQGLYREALAGCEELQTLGAASGDAQIRTWGLVGAAENLLSLGEDKQAVPLISTAEGLLAENLGGTRAEEIWAYALLGRAALRRNQPELAVSLAASAASLIGPVPPAAIYALGGYSAIAEVYLELWQAGYRSKSAQSQQLMLGAAQACGALGRFALIFPVGRPATLTWRGLQMWMHGRRSKARRVWAQAIGLAARVGMPYEEGRALFQSGRHASGDQQRRNLERAMEIFRHLGCRYELAQTQALLDNRERGLRGPAAPEK